MKNLNRLEKVNFIKVVEEAKKSCQEDKYRKAFSKLQKIVLTNNKLAINYAESLLHTFSPLMYFESERPELDSLVEVMNSLGYKFKGIISEQWDYIKEFNPANTAEFPNYTFVKDGIIVNTEAPSFLQIESWMEAHNQK